MTLAGLPSPIVRPGCVRVDWPTALARVCAAPGVVRPVFQPIVDLKRSVACGYELLTRFSGPPLAPPDVWFAAAAEHGFSARLESMVIACALRVRGVLPPNTFLTVNASAEALLSREVATIFRDAGSLARLVIEITEQTEVQDHDALAAALAPLRAAGAMVAVDDVGAGYAGLGQVVAIRPEFVKLDRRYVSEVHRDEAKAALVATIGDLASRIEAWVVAEGVGRVDELEALIRLRVPLSQGYLFARPEAGLVELDDSLGALLWERSFARLARAGVGVLAEPAPVVRDQDGSEAIARLFSADASVDYLPVLDELGRPVAVLSREGFRGRAGARRLPPLRVLGGSAVADVARRAMIRPPGERFDPVVCCDEDGRYVGLVRVERLVQELAAS